MTDPPHVDGVSHHWVEARGLRFHVAEAGAGEDVVLCLHGWPQHWYEWRHLMPALADRHRVLAMDLRGFGWSDAPRSGYEKENLVDDVLAVLDALDLKRVKLVGHDWGGWIGFLLCLRAPQRIDRFLAMNITHPWPRPGAMLRHIWRFWYQQVIMTPGLGYVMHRRGCFVRHILRSWVTDPTAWDEATLSAFADNLAEPERAHACVQMYRTFHLHEAWRGPGRYGAQRLTVPTRLLFGVEDRAIHPALVGGYESHTDDMEVELVPGCGHFIVDEKPDLVADRALSFFA
ncbi:MAG TPA: alpha/beta hydrolase [Solirubrobacterales bacterium]